MKIPTTPLLARSVLVMMFLPMSSTRSPMKPIVLTGMGM